MKKLLGANYLTTVLGWITILAVAIATKPDLIAFLPDSWEPYVSGICGLIAVVSAGSFAYQTKSKDVTGGSVQQDFSGNIVK